VGLKPAEHLASHPDRRRQAGEHRLHPRPGGDDGAAGVENAAPRHQANTGAARLDRDDLFTDAQLRTGLARECELRLDCLLRPQESALGLEHPDKARRHAERRKSSHQGGVVEHLMGKPVHQRRAQCPSDEIALGRTDLDDAGDGQQRQAGFRCKVAP